MTTAYDLKEHNERQARIADLKHEPIIRAYEKTDLTLEQVGRRFGLSKQRISQIVARARQRGLIE